MLAVVAVLAYANSFSGQFLLDDHASILGNPELGSLGGMVRKSTRPLTQATFHLNYVIGGLHVADYHLVNLVIHIAAALALYGVVRRTLEKGTGRDGEGRKGSEGVALVVAAVWMVHPVQTASVTYIVQRAESLMGMFYLLTLYCAIRGMSHCRTTLQRSSSSECAAQESHATAESATIHHSRFTIHSPWPWHTATVTACALGMLSKPVMVTAPVAVLLYDRAYVSGGFVEALRRHRYLYVGLAATWLVLAVLLLLPHESSQSAGVVPGLASPGSYLVTQAGVVLHYLKLVFVPTAVCLDYAWPVASSWREVAVPGVVLALLFAGAVWAFVRRHPLGFPAVFFFLALAPSSSVIPVADCAFDHRMYLPLAGVVAVVVSGLYGLLVTQRRRTPLLRTGRAGVSIVASILTGLVVAGLVSMTHMRNRDYHGQERMWADVVSKRPGNLRAQQWMIDSMMDRGDLDEAEEAARRLVRVIEALEAPPGDSSKAYHLTMALDRLGRILVARGKLREAVGHYRNAIRAEPGNRVAHCNLAVALFLAGQPEEALAACGSATEIDNGYTKAHSMKGVVLRSLSRFKEAIEAYRRAIESGGDVVQATYGLGWLLAACPETELCDGDTAVQLAEEVVTATGGRSHMALDLLAAAYARVGKFDDAVRTAERALAAAPEQGGERAAGLPHVERDTGARGIRRRLELYRAGKPFTDRAGD